MRGTPVADRLLGRAGDDRLLGEAGPDCLSGGRGADHLRGGAGSDIMRGGAGHDRISARGGRRGKVRDVVDCGPGRDVAKVDPRDTVTGCEIVRRG
jgi:Ca2+-binding RTX toxin-like protein